MFGENKDTYILSGIGANLGDLLKQKTAGFNPGVKVFIKDTKTLEVTSTMLNLDQIEEIPAKTGSFHFTGVVSKGFRISEYFYAEESPVEGYLSVNNYDICPIHISSNHRQSRDYIAPSERKNLDRVQNSKDLYMRWKQVSKNTVTV